MASHPYTYYTPEQYLEIERAARFKSEYIAGEMFAMAGASRKHNLITGNIYTILNLQLESRPCEAYSNDMRVNVGMAFFYPDIVVACGKIELLDDRDDTLLNPTVVFEVLSRSTEAYDRGEKFARYTELPSLQDFLLVSQEQHRVEHYTRQAGDKWLLSVHSKFDSVIELAAIDCRLPVNSIYRKIEFAPR